MLLRTQIYVLAAALYAIALVGNPGKNPVTNTVSELGNDPATAASAFLANYKGMPYRDAKYSGGAQLIPGRVQCAYYDLGGEGIAYHDTTPDNEGSGKLNPANGTYLNEFRMHEAVDTSYTKFHDPHQPIDDNPYNLVVPEENQLYVGWTIPGEWFNMTVDVAKAGYYSGNLLYTSRHGGNISVDVNGQKATAPIAIPSTVIVADPIAWRQWHHWNVMTDAVKLRLAAGRSVITIHIETEGNMNLAYLEFKEMPKHRIVTR